MLKELQYHLTIKDLGLGVACAMIGGMLAVLLLPYVIWQWITGK